MERVRLARPHGEPFQPAPPTVAPEDVIVFTRAWRLTWQVTLCWLVSAGVCRGDGLQTRVEAALVKAADNRAEIRKALDAATGEQREGLEFLVAYMPDRDLRNLSAEALLENTRLAYLAWREAPWANDLPREIFLNYVLPYANLNERRDDWRADFMKRFRPLVKDARRPAEAAALLNQKIFPLLKVRYSTQRRRADQCPTESIQTGLASCTGLSILLIDACRAVGVPARFVGTPLWTNKSGNHSWVEIWDGDWHFTGAAEPTGMDLNRAWFSGRAATAIRDDPRHAILAVSYRHTPLKFPLVWDRTVDYVFAVNVTDRYTRGAVALPEGVVPVMFRVLERGSRARVPAELKVRDIEGQVVFQGRTKDEQFDANDHLTVNLTRGQKYRVEIRHDGRLQQARFQAGQRDLPFTFTVEKPAGEPEPNRTQATASRRPGWS